MRCCSPSSGPEPTGAGAPGGAVPAGLYAGAVRARAGAAHHAARASALVAAHPDGPMPIAPPTHGVERSLRRAGATLVAGVDEVGRGAWAGPVSVGACITGLRRPPE